MRPKVAAILSGVASDDVTLHAGDLELINLMDLRNDPAPDPILGDFEERRVRQLTIPALFVGVVSQQCGLATDIAHEARLFTALPLIGPDQGATQFLLEYVRQEQYGGSRQGAGRASGFQQLTQLIKHHSPVASVRCERHNRLNAQARIEYQPKLTDGRHRPLVGRFACHSPEHSADSPVEIPEEPNTGYALSDAPLGLVVGIDTDPKETSLNVIQHLPVGLNCAERCYGPGVGS